MASGPLSMAADERVDGSVERAGECLIAVQKVSGNGLGLRGAYERPGTNRLS